MSLTGTLFGGLSGSWVEAHGYTSLYVISFLGSLPSMLLIPFVPIEGHASGAGWLSWPLRRLMMLLALASLLWVAVLWFVTMGPMVGG